MEDKNINLEEINKIDMECSVSDDDCDGFGGANAFFKQEANTEPVGERNLVRTTGVKISFDDDPVEDNFKEIEIIDSPALTAQMADDGIAFNIPEGDFKGYNEIDMECTVGEDDEFVSSTPRQKVLDFGDDEELGIVSEEVVKESKKTAAAQIDQGVVEDDYYEKLKKKHAATNVKGAYNTHFHFSGNPKAEMELFNADMTPAGPIPNAVTASSEAAAEASMSESKNNPSYRKLFEDILRITGFEMKPQDDHKLIFVDAYNKKNCKVCETINDLTTFLDPYMEDCFIIPLQIETGEEFKTCGDWKNWYDANSEKFPQCKNDIIYCDVYANHLPECKLF